MSEKLIIFLLLVVYQARQKQPDEIQISGEMKSGCFYIVRGHNVLYTPLYREVPLESLTQKFVWQPEK